MPSTPMTQYAWSCWEWSFGLWKHCVAGISSGFDISEGTPLDHWCFHIETYRIIIFHPKEASIITEFYCRSGFQVFHLETHDYWNLHSMKTSFMIGRLLENVFLCTCKTDFKFCWNEKTIPATDLNIWVWLTWQVTVFGPVTTGMVSPSATPISRAGASLLEPLFVVAGGVSWMVSRVTRNSSISCLDSSDSRLQFKEVCILRNITKHHVEIFLFKWWQTRILAFKTPTVMPVLQSCCMAFPWGTGVHVVHCLWSRSRTSIYVPWFLGRTFILFQSNNFLNISVSGLLESPVVTTNNWAKLGFGLGGWWLTHRSGLACMEKHRFAPFQDFHRGDSCCVKVLVLILKDVRMDLSNTYFRSWKWCISQCCSLRNLSRHASHYWSSTLPRCDF